MSISQNEYELVDSIKANVPDCFVARNNKIGSGNGEAKFYIGGTAIKDWNAFFDDLKIPCVFAKKDLLYYMDLAKIEYEEQTQNYKNNISQNWQPFREQLEKLPNEIVFTIYRKAEQDKRRFYIQSNDEIWTTFRKLALPIMTSLLIQKVKINEKLFIWFRPYINEIGNVFENEVVKDFIDKEIDKVEKDVAIKDTVKVQLNKARIGQGDFRDKMLAKCNSKCIITQIDDNRILIASHIKPWSISTNAERLSKENGLLLTPTYDKLFDKGLISFRDSGEIMLSDYFSEKNFKILNLIPKVKYSLKITDEMKKYLEYHRESVFIK